MPRNDRKLLRLLKNAHLKYGQTAIEDIDARSGRGITGRFSFKRGQFGMLVCRAVAYYKTLIKRCQAAYSDDGD